MVNTAATKARDTVTKVNPRLLLLNRNSRGSIGFTDYEFIYASAIQKDNFYGVQFHPEKSGKSGERILQNFLNL